MADPADRLALRVAQLHAVLTSGSYRYTSELELQDALAAQMTASGVQYVREVSLGDQGQPDFLVGHRPHIALEVKVGGSRADLLRQVDRYLDSPIVGACVVATTRSHHRDLPPTLRDKLLQVAWLSGGALGGPITRGLDGNGTDVGRNIAGEVDGGDQMAGPRPGSARVPRNGIMVRHGEGWALDLQPHVLARFRRMFPRAGRAHGTILMDGLPGTCRDLLWFCDRYPLQLSDLDRAHLQLQAELYDRRRACVAELAAGTFQARPFRLALPPRPYQAKAAELALMVPGLLVADEVGLGKTVSAIAALTEPSTRPALVVTETHLTHQWRRELARFAPELRTHILRQGTPYDVTRPKGSARPEVDRFHPPGTGPHPFPDVLISTYGKLRGWADALAPHLPTVIYDEVQALRRGDESARGRAAYHISKHATHRIGLSATPIYNYGDETWRVMEALHPGALGELGDFQAEWCVGGSGGKVVSDPAALGAWLREEGMMIRRTRADVGRELPPLHNVPWLVDADLRALERVSKDVRDLARAILRDDTPNLERGRSARELDIKLRQATGIAKAPFVAAFVLELLKQGAKRILVGGWHREVYRIWLDQLSDFDPVLYTGTESPAQKRRAAEAFIVGDSPILCISLRSGAGLDGLQGCGCVDVVHGELDWSYQVHHQLTGRVHRDGQPENVTAWYLHADAGSDPPILDILGLKRGQSDGLLDPTGANPQAPADHSRARALARRILGRQ